MSCHYHVNALREALRTYLSSQKKPRRQDIFNILSFIEDTTGNVIRIFLSERQAMVLFTSKENSTSAFGTAAVSDLCIIYYSTPYFRAESDFVNTAGSDGGFMENICISEQKWETLKMGLGFMFHMQVLITQVGLHRCQCLLHGRATYSCKTAESSSVVC